MASATRHTKSPLMKLVNDCLYGMCPIPEYAHKVIQHPLFKRLGRVKQLGTLHHAWPSATHTRLEHSIGTMILAERYSDILGFRSALRRAFGLASLLHDIGHGPFSHVFEQAVKNTPTGEIFRDHDHWRVRLIADNATLTHAIASEEIDVFPTFQQCNEAVGDILAIWNDNPDQAMFLTPQEIHIAHALLAGVAGVDRLDYLLRDSYHTNPQHQISPSTVDAILYNTTVDLSTGTVEYTPDGHRYVQLLLEARAYMHREVYTHHRAIEADLAIAAAFQMPSFDDEIRPLMDVLRFERLTDSWVEQSAYDDRLHRVRHSLQLLRAIRGDTERLERCDPSDPDAIHTRTIHGPTPADLAHIKNRWDIPDCTIAFRPATDAVTAAIPATHSSESVPNDPPPAAAAAAAPPAAPTSTTVSSSCT